VCYTFLGLQFIGTLKAFERLEYLIKKIIETWKPKPLNRIAKIGYNKRRSQNALLY